MEIRQVSDIDSLHDHRDAWNALAFGDALAPDPYNTYPWIASHLEHRLEPSRRFGCYLAYRGDRLEGVLPVAVCEGSRLGLGLPALEALVDRHTVSIDCVTRPGTACATVAAILDAIRRDFGPFRRLSFKRIHEESALRREIPEHGPRWIRLEEPDGPGFYLEAQGSYEEYRKELPTGFRANLRNARNRLRKLANVGHEFLGPDEITDEHIAEFMAIESSGWKGRSGSATGANERNRRFYLAALTRFREAGALRMQFLRGDGRLLAAMFSVQIGATLFVCKIGYNEDYSRCSPGVLLMESIFEYACQDPGIDRVDCLSDMPWLRHWRLDQKQYLNVQVFPRAAVAMALGYLPARLRLIAKQSPHLRAMVGAVRSWGASRRGSPGSGPRATVAGDAPPVAEAISHVPSPRV